MISLVHGWHGTKNTAPPRLAPLLLACMHLTSRFTPFLTLNGWLSLRSRRRENSTSHTSKQVPGPTCHKYVTHDTKQPFKFNHFFQHHKISFTQFAKNTLLQNLQTVIPPNIIFFKQFDQEELQSITTS